MTEEDEAFNKIERQAKQRKESVRAAINKEKQMNNQPAFPTGIITDGKGMIIGGSNGMNLRDYFAAKAMVKLMGTQDIDGCCESAYRWADAMLKAREA